MGEGGENGALRDYMYMYNPLNSCYNESYTYMGDVAYSVSTFIICIFTYPCICMYIVHYMYVHVHVHSTCSAAWYFAEVHRSILYGLESDLLP